MYPSAITPSSLLVTFLCLSTALSVPAPSSPEPTPLSYRGTFKRPKRSTRERGGLEWAKAERDRVLAKYNGPNSAAGIRHRERVLSKAKRAGTATGSSAVIDVDADESYETTLSIGTPPVQYQVVMDTGSSDFWLLSTACGESCSQAQATTDRYSSAGSSTFDASGSVAFGDPYGSGSVNGTTATETVTLGGLTVEKQPFGVVDVYEGNVVGTSATGLMGLAFSTIAVIGTPWWQNSLNSWAEPLFTFALARQITNPDVEVEEPGGLFTMGAVDSSLYTGDITYVDIPADAQSFWQIPVDEITIQGGQLQTTDQLAAIDTGTTLIAGPQQFVDELYSTIPGVQIGTGQEEGLYFFPCSTVVNTSITFGGVTWPIDPDDFGTPVGQGLCYGAFFTGLTGDISRLKGKQDQYTQVQAPDWIVGDVFLKNVYAVFRASPASVGFAALADPAALASITTGLSLTAGATATPGIASVGGQSVSGERFTTITTGDGLFGTVTVVLPVESGIGVTSGAMGRGGWIGGLWTVGVAVGVATVLGSLLWC